VPDPKGRGGLDADFCRHSPGAFRQASEVWMCPKCGYAALFWDFNRPVDEDVKTFVEKTITPGAKEVLRREIALQPKGFEFEDFSFFEQKDLPEFLKYENATATYRKRGVGHRVLARLHLGAAHAYRRLVSGPVGGVGLDRAVRRVNWLLEDPAREADDVASLAGAAHKLLAGSEAAGAEGQRTLRLRDRVHLLILLAGLHDRLGQGWQSVRCLARARELIEERERVQEVKYALILKEALRLGEVRGADLVASIYLTGELLARTGEAGKAVPWREATSILASEAGGEDPKTERLAQWSRSRLELLEALAEEGVLDTTPDADEREFVERVLAVEPARGEPQILEDEAPEVAARPPGAERLAAPDAEEAGPADPASREGSGPSAPQQGCRDRLHRIWKAIEAWRAARGGFPPDLEALAEASFISRGAAGDFACPDSDSRLFYRRPSAGKARDFVVYHADPRACHCKLILYSDGTIGAFGGK
jgi:hypothetical protein